MVLEDLFLLLHFYTRPQPVHNPSSTFLPVHIRFYPSKWQVDGSLDKAMVVTTRVLVVLGGSVTSQIDTDRHYCDSAIHDGYTVLNAECQVFTTNIPSLLWRGFGPGLRVCLVDVPGGCANHYTSLRRHWPVFSAMTSRIICSSFSCFSRSVSFMAVAQHNTAWIKGTRLKW